MRREEIPRNRHADHQEKARSDSRKITNSHSSKDVSRHHDHHSDEADRRAAVRKDAPRSHDNRNNHHHHVHADGHDSNRHVQEDRHNSKRHIQEDRHNSHRHVQEVRRNADRQVQEDDHRNSRKGENGRNVQLKRRPDHDRHKQKEEGDESFEELSRRKRRIELELKSLDKEEAAARQEAKKKKYTDDKSSKPRPAKQNDHRSSNAASSSHNHPVRVKEEPPSDDERRNRRHPPETNRRPTGSRTRNDNNRESHGNSRPHSSNQWGSQSQEESRDQAPPKEKEKPNFKTSGKLAEDTNTFNGVVIKYNEPSEARKPKRKWRLYPFKGSETLPFIPVYKQSAYLLGRTRLIADIPIDHPSCSKQHAILQFRLLPYEREDGKKGRSVRPYIIDLDSANGTFVNNKKLQPRCYVELFEKDVLKFGFSSRVYVILHEDSKNDDEEEES